MLDSLKYLLENKILIKTICFVIYVAVRMGILDNMVVQWENIVLYDVVMIIYSIFLIVFVITSNNFFADFVASKPEGRKTAVGELIDNTK